MTDVGPELSLLERTCLIWKYESKLCLREGVVTLPFSCLEESQVILLFFPEVIFVVSW